MKTLRIVSAGAAALIALLATRAAQASLVSIESSSDNHGLFTYRVTRNDDQYTLGSASQLLAFSVRAYQVVSTVSPPGWMCSNAGDTMLTWTCTNTAAAIIDDNALEFSFNSAVPNVVSYTDPSFAEQYPQGVIAGEVYDGASRARFPSGDAVSAANVAGQERFVHLGPLVPEPAGMTAVLGACALLARRKHAR
ncbi:hypothetical protein GX586_16390 [bacterium]|nr:hypothetical protein [bacterium]